MAFRLVLANLAMQSGMVYPMLYSIRPVLHPGRKYNQFPIEVRPICIGIDGYIFFPLGILPFYMA